MFGLDFSTNQKFAISALIGLAAIGLSVGVARNASGLLNQGVTISEPSDGQASVSVNGSDAMNGSDQNDGQVTFQVAGNVRSPGVYTLPVGKRVIDAVNAAGGALPGADLQSLSLAEKIDDGAKIVVPTVGGAGGAGSVAPADVAAHALGSGPSAVTDKFKNPGEGTVSINSASMSELQRLPGVGPSTAQKILDYRAQIGRFASAEQLMDVKGIGSKKFEKMRPFVRL